MSSDNNNILIILSMYFIIQRYCFILELWLNLTHLSKIQSIIVNKKDRFHIKLIIVFVYWLFNS